MSFSMTGTTGSAYFGILRTSNGQLGIRDLGLGRYRVRVEPAIMSVNSVGDALPNSWTQPTNDNVRFSTVVSGGVELASAIAAGAAAIA